MTAYYLDTNVVLRADLDDGADGIFSALWSVAAELAVFTSPDLAHAMGKEAGLCQLASERLGSVSDRTLTCGMTEVTLSSFSVGAARILLSIAADPKVLFARFRDNSKAMLKHTEVSLSTKGEELLRYEVTRNDCLGSVDMMIVADAVYNGVRHDGPSGLFSDDWGLREFAKRVGFPIIDRFEDVVNVQPEMLRLTGKSAFVPWCRSVSQLSRSHSEDGRSILFVTGKAVTSMIREGRQFTLPARATNLFAEDNARFVVTLGTALAWQLSANRRYNYAQGIERRRMTDPPLPLDSDDHCYGLKDANRAGVASGLLRALIPTERGGIGRLAVDCQLPNGGRLEGVAVEASVVVPNESIMQILTGERFASQPTSVLTTMTTKRGQVIVTPNVQEHTDLVTAKTLDVPLTVLTTSEDAHHYRKIGLDVVAF